MTPPVPACMLEEFVAFVAERTGLHFPPERLPDLERRVEQAACELGYPDAEACVRSFLDYPPDRERLETLAGRLTVGETYFFRNGADFAAIENGIFPEIMASRGGQDTTLRVWSAGCSTGEEPYSVAMLFDRLGARRAGWEVSILATDINSAALRQAQRGLYGEWSFRGVPQAVKERYFTAAADGRLELAPRIREQVSFGWLNLVEDSYPSLINGTNGMDLIICRNVLMYFRPDLAAAVLRRFRDSLRDGGWLILGAIEAPVFAPEAAEGEAALAGNERFHGVTVYRKTERAPLRRPRPHEPEARPVREAPPVRPGPPPEAPDPLGEGETFYSKGLYTEASARLERLLAAEPRNKAALMLMARIRANLGDINGAAAFCSKAVLADKLDPLPRCLLGDILQEEGRYEEAETSFRHAVYLEPGHVMAHFALGNLSLRADRPAEARRHFLNAAELAGRRGPDEPLPGSDGLSAGRLVELARAALKRCADD
ncbi:MAG: tetratricopeptide repeat protein [Elusimicrobia bacterium]|nr:tetratricopeptide repeat protein [Elusimicrobiota bacterium]